MKRYNPRVYGIIINDAREILVSDEFEYGMTFTKFPGGGLEWGEGLKDCLRREINEELRLDCEIGAFLYVNDFFQASAFREDDQLLSFYFLVEKIDFSAIPVSAHSVPLTEPGEKFRWIPLNEISEEDFTFPVDKVVAVKLHSL